MTKLVTFRRCLSCCGRIPVVQHVPTARVIAALRLLVRCCCAVTQPRVSALGGEHADRHDAQSQLQSAHRQQLHSEIQIH